MTAPEIPQNQPDLLDTLRATTDNGIRRKISEIKAIDTRSRIAVWGATIGLALATGIYTHSKWFVQQAESSNNFLPNLLFGLSIAAVVYSSTQAYRLERIINQVNTLKNRSILEIPQTERRQLDPLVQDLFLLQGVKRYTAFQLPIIEYNQEPPFQILF